MKYLIVGLGNIGSQYQNTRHNIGFQALDAFAKASNLVFSPDRYGDTTTYKYKGKVIKLVKPSTYMNLSGKAVNYWLQKEKIPISDCLIIVDDLSLPFGSIRIKPSGSSAGHNGLENISETLGTNDFPRLRFGIGSDFPKGRQVEYVLGNWSEEEIVLLTTRLERIIEAIKSFSTIGLERTMNYFNGKK